MTDFLKINCVSKVHLLLDSLEEKKVRSPINSEKPSLFLKYDQKITCPGLSSVREVCQEIDSYDM